MLIRFLTKTTKNIHFFSKLPNAQQLHNSILWISNQEDDINPKQEKEILRIPYIVYTFSPQNPSFDPNLKTLNTLQTCIIQICI